jgi:hypothetical protein
MTNKMESKMEESKPWYMSKAVWGSLGVIAFAVIGMGALGLEPSAAVDAVGEEQKNINQLVILLVELIGGVLGLYGRLKAKQAIGKRSKP